MKPYKRQAVFGELKDFCLLSKEHDYIEVCEWHNGEGFDVEVFSNNTSQQFQLTWGQFKLLIKLVTKLESNEEE